MHAAVRPYATAGIALIGAGAIAVSPVAPPLPQVHLPAVSNAAVQLSAFANPVEQWVQVVATAFSNVGDLGTGLIADPAPALAQVLRNQVANGTTIATALQGAVTALVDQFSPDNEFGLPAELQTAFDQLTAGQIADAVQTVWSAGLGLVLGPVIGLLPVLDIPGDITQNFANVVKALPTAGLLVGLGVLTPLYATLTAGGDTAQAFVDAVGEGDAATALSTVINAPATLVGALLNRDTNAGTEGLLSSSGTIAALLSVRDTIAQALGAPLPELADVAEANAATTPKAITVTLATPPVVKSIEAPKGLDVTKLVKLPKALTPTSEDKTEAAAGASDPTGADTAGESGTTTTSSPTTAGGSDSSTTPSKPAKVAKHRAQSDNPVSSALKKIRDSVQKATAPKHTADKTAAVKSSANAA
jgi:hypothetical protein